MGATYPLGGTRHRRGTPHTDGVRSCLTTSLHSPRTHRCTEPRGQVLKHQVSLTRPFVGLGVGGMGARGLGLGPAAGSATNHGVPW